MTRRFLRVAGVVVLVLVMLWIGDRVFNDGIVASLLLYVLKGSGPPGGF